VSQALLGGARANAALTDDRERWQLGAVRLSAELPLLRPSFGSRRRRLSLGRMPWSLAGRAR
jgi:hypothetical protein